MSYVLALAVAVAVPLWFMRNPRCPSCNRRKWDRKLCAPLLLCRHCAQRIDSSGARQN